MRSKEVEQKVLTFIIFDIDGVILRENIKPLFGRLAYAIGKTFGRYDMPTKFIKGGTDSVVLQKLANLNGISFNEFRAHSEELEIHSLKFVKKHLNEANLYPQLGLVKLLKILKKEGYILGIATGNAEGIAKTKLRKLRVYNFFKVFAFDKGSKNKSEILKKALLEFDRKYGRRSNTKIFYLGDSEGDLIAARQIGIKSIAVATGRTKIKKLMQMSPNLAIEDLTKTEKIIKFLRT